MLLHKRSGGVLLTSHGNLGASQMWELVPGWPGVCCARVPTAGPPPRLPLLTDVRRARTSAASSGPWEELDTAGLYNRP